MGDNNDERWRAGRAVREHWDQFRTTSAYFRLHAWCVRIARFWILVGKSFVDIIRDMTPDSMPQIDMISGGTGEEQV